MWCVRVRNVYEKNKCVYCVYMGTLQSSCVGIFNVVSKFGGYHVELNKSTEVKKFNPQNMAIVLAEYDGKKLVYDLMDGYQNIDEISRLLKECDYYYQYLKPDMMIKRTLDIVDGK